MKVGICFGGYCPLHQGHMDVIMKAKKENDVCYVIVCGYDNEPRGWEINLTLSERYKLISDFFKEDEQIRVRMINDTELGIDESMSDHNWIVWQEKVYELLAADKVCQNTPDYKSNNIMWYVAEPYYKTCIERNNVLQKRFGNIFVDVELVSKANPVSGTLIRHNPVKYWNKITAPFKPYLCKNILIIGTASEGKSTLVRDISRYFDIPYAEEYGRTYMAERNMKDTQLTRRDFMAFLDGQINECKKHIKESKNGIFISDTDNAVTLMYALAYVEDPHIYLTQDDFDKLYEHALKHKDDIKWDKIFIFPPSKTFVDDGTRYMAQSSMEERNKNIEKLNRFVNQLYPEVTKVYLNGSFMENFNNVKDYINTLIEG